jgi:hypothetical protein
MDEAEPDVLPSMIVAKVCAAMLHSTYSIERVSGEIKRRTEISLMNSFRRCGQRKLARSSLTVSLLCSDDPAFPMPYFKTSPEIIRQAVML